MSNLNRESVEKLTELCRIECTEAEVEALLKDLKSILDYIDQLQEVDTSNVEPCNHVLAEIHNVMRDDIVGETMPREVFLANAPSHTGGMIKVPPVISKNKG
ncbi:MAG: Asp-tRNA(Asn)/Glu-tRNA(Gln) amidotransferase subunit GatC [Chlamydiales bacterium]|nr:Asp-tRNA(Asn)/Glu-tRNA(Gln) amidotransferase subunit GatC [Chlamydiia bacterium]MCP5508666.1 Asp-tRNA(Asn)/Glu-tRNA(Gln) amidotransferase subunit GatC [Chlamydiales bacterium]